MDLLTCPEDIAAAAGAMPLDELRDSLIAAAASIAAAEARLAQALAVFRSRGGADTGSGFASFGQWASVDLGMSSRAATSLADAGAALANRPLVRSAWESGALSRTKAQCVLGVASDASEAGWCDLASEASATQLARIASAYRRSVPTDEAVHRESLCGAWWRRRDDGLEELLAILTPDDAAVVRAALDCELEQQWRAEDSSEQRPTAGRRSDALVAVAANRLATGPVPLVRGEHTEVVIHVDQEVFAGLTDSGLCHATSGAHLSVADAHRLACDARIRPLLKTADGTAVDLGRSQRIVSDKQRRLLTARDHGCRFPGCANTRFVDAHHVIAWEHGGATDMANLVLLCNHHHRLLHHGGFRIESDGQQHFTFHDRHGHQLGPPGVAADQPCPGAPDTPHARSGGDRNYSIELAVAAVSA